MAGPNGTAVLDDFTRADAATLGANWTADPFNFGLSSLRVSSNTCIPAADNYGANWWNATQFAANQEVFCKLTTAPSNNVRLLTRLINPGSASASGYALILSAFDAVIYRVDNTGLTLLQSVTGVPASGDRWALVISGNALTVYRDTGGGWTSVGSTTDSTYAGAGYIGLYSQSNTTLVMDDFGGGALSVPKSLALAPARYRRRALLLR